MWELISFVQAENRKICLKSLNTNPKTPSQIAMESNHHLTHISRALRELSEKGLVECLTPNLNKNRYYGITDRGKIVLKEINNLCFK